jgi:ATP-dependent helicase/nuclease subunit A
LVPELTDPTLNTGINLFIVGDVKQSIYGFRNADVRVFTKAIQDITSINKLKVETDEISSMPLESMNYDRDYEESEFLGKNRLTSTFRLLAIPAAFTNFVFRNLMNNSKSEFEVMYEDLICSRNIEKLQIANGRIIADDECGKIVFLISEKTPSDTDSENFGAESTNSNDEDITDLTEELNIASYIQSIIGSKLFSSKDGNLIDYKDIAVLSHKTTNFSKLSKVLHQSKIPHIFNGGQGFYKTSEVDDLLTFLRFIYNPNDDISFVALMRSPYMNFSDSEILKIRKYNLSRTLWDNFSELAKVELWDKVRKFYKMLNGIRNYSVSQTIPTVIYKIIETFGLSGKNVIESSYEQRTANINKFMDMARNFESQGFKNLIDFVDEVNFISENSIRESEAPVISDDNVVNILTIHGSKGLQFPVVILYNTNSASGNDSYMQVSQHFGISFKLNLANDMNYENKNITPFSFINKLIHDQMIEAEAKRVLYVAMTRAEEILVISALLDTNKEGGFKKTKSYLRLILEGMQLDADKLINLNVLKTELGLRLNDRIQNFKIEFNPEIITTFIKSINTKIKEQSTVPLNLNSNVNSKQMNELFSASKFMTYQNDSEEYLFRYLLGFLDDDNEPINDGLRQSDDEPIGVFPGKIIHAVMEKIKLCTDEMGSVNEDNLRRIISSITLSDAFGELNKLNNRVLSECKAVTETKLIRSELENLKSAEFEKTMLMPVGDNFINSIVDVFFTNSKKEIEIWDWKTNLVNSISETKVLAEKYRIQMKIYAYLASKYEPEQMSFKTRLLFTRLAKQNIDDEKWTYEFTWSRAELEEFEQSLKGQISEMRDKLYFWL